MFLTMIVGLYTSRVVLATLGVEDYGIYGVVGGIVAMMGFLNASMSGATSRFLTFELGRGNKERLEKTFSTAFIIHVIIALIVFVIAETVGLWFLCNKLVIPEARMEAAHWVYQLSILSAMLGITQVPYNACIIAHEKMDVYAYVEILNVSLKLLIVYMLLIGNFDKLILYAILMLGVSVIVMIVYRIYCISRFSESHFHFIWDKEYLKPMLSFSGWDVLGHFGFTWRTNGVNFVINMFFGVATNAASAVANTVQGVLFGFSSNIQTAFKPQIIKKHSIGNNEGMARLIYIGMKGSILLILIISIPFNCSINYLLTIWLKNVPTYSNEFCKVMLWSNIVSSISQIIYCGIQATGELKQTSIIRNIIYISVPFIVYLHFISGPSSPIGAYVIILLSQIILTIADISILTLKIHHIKVQHISMIIFSSSLCCAFTLICCEILKDYVLDDLLYLTCASILSTLSLGMSFIFLVFNSKERTEIIKMAKKLLKKN